MRDQPNIHFTSTGKVQPYAWPGGYPIFYIADDCATLCPGCVQNHVDEYKIDPEHEFFITASGINWECEMYCDGCNEQIESAYEVQL